MAYTTETKIENYMMIDIDSSLSSQVSDWISAATLYIDSYTGKKDGFESASEERSFDGSGKRIQRIDDFTSLTTIQILEFNSEDVELNLTEGWNNDFISLPHNDVPQYELLMSPNSNIGFWSAGQRRIKITGIWGHSTSVPSDIELSATMLVAKVIEKGQRGGNISSERLGDYSVTFTTLDEEATKLGIKPILDTYKLLEL